MNGNDLDRYITGGWGEDSVAPEFVRARKLGDFGMEEHIVIDIAPQADEKVIPVTVIEVRDAPHGMLHIKTKELAWPLLIPEDATIYFADTDDE